MNLRLSHDEVRFRIAENEFEALCADGLISDQIEFSAGRKVEYQIVVSSKEDTNEQRDPRVTFDKDCVTLYVSRDRLLDLKERTNDKSGIVGKQLLETGTALTCSLQIDIKSKRASNRR